MGKTAKRRKSFGDIFRQQSPKRPPMTKYDIIHKHITSEINSEDKENQCANPEQKVGGSIRFILHGDSKYHDHSVHLGREQPVGDMSAPLVAVEKRKVHIVIGEYRQSQSLCH